GVSAMTTAHFNGSPLVVLGGRAPQGRWGAGSLQELDHVPIVASITKLARTVTAPDDIPKEVGEAVATALTPHRGPVFLDFPLDVVFAHGSADVPAAVTPSAVSPDAGASRPVLVAGSDVWWNGAWEALRRCVESLRVPTFVNGMGRGCLPADHELAFARTRRFLKQADVVVVVGTPLDFRLSFGSFGAAQVVHVVDSPDQRASHVQTAASPAGDFNAILDGFASYGGSRADHEEWIGQLRAEEDAAREAEKVELDSDADPIHPARVYGELRKRLARDAVVIGDGGDFVSYAGKLVDSYEPGCWMDPGPYGCLGTGVGYAVAARVAHPDRQVVLLLGDGAIGFNGMDFDTLVRHQLPVVAVVGNNGIWGLEKHPMPGLRYDDVVKALGGAGETVSSPKELGPALDRAFAAGVPYLVNVLTDPAIAYPRSSNLA
ncbi:MAG: acetolactate synthase, partial [Actinobacteria bacterium]